jgi:hypothetical protein
MARKKKRGRPFTFKLADRKRFAELIRRHGARGAQHHSIKPISVGTLLKIAHEFGIELRKGRRGRSATTQSPAKISLQGKAA